MTPLLRAALLAAALVSASAEPEQAAKTQGVDPPALTPEALEALKAQEERQPAVETDLNDLTQFFGVDRKKFVPSHVITFDVPAKKKVCIYEDIAVETSMRLNGAFFVNKGGKRDLFLQVKGPMHKKGQPYLYETKQATSEDKFSVNVTVAGPYKFCFDNTFSMTASKRVTFAVDVDPQLSVEEMLKKDELEPTKDVLRRLTRQTYVLQQGVKYMGLRLDTQAQVQNTTNHHVVWWTVLESAMVLVVTFGQVFYIQQLINNRKVGIVGI
jgi:hypothetical protein